MSKFITNADTVKSRAQFEILPRDTHAPAVVEIDGRQMKWGSSGAFTTSDVSLAREIDARYGRDSDGLPSVMVVPVERRQEPGHQRTFAVRLPKNYKRKEQTNDAERNQNLVQKP